MSVEDQNKKQPDILDANNLRNQLSGQEKIVSREDRWRAVSLKIEKTADALGHGIDKNIKDLVIALNVHGVNTTQSCEGHAEKENYSAPWVQMEAPNEPDERFNSQNETFEKVAKEHNLPVEEVKRMTPEDAYWEAMNECSKNGETEKYIKWKEEGRKLMEVVKEILGDFYKNRKAQDSIKIKIENNIDKVGEGNFRLYNGGKDYQIIEKDLDGKEKEELEKRIERYQIEMDHFKEFLRDKFFTKGEDYVYGIIKNVQEKIDQEKINKITETFKESEAEIYVKENLKDFEKVEVKKMSELIFWREVNIFLANKGITDIEDEDVIIIDDEEKWKNIYGSNDSKSSYKPKIIILKKEIFDNENISIKNISWCIHEIGHLEFYKSLGEKLDEYMKKYHASGEYAASAMEKMAFQLQFNYLKSIGKTKSECMNLVQEYLNKSFKKDEEKEEGFKQIEKYVDNVYK